MTAANTCTVRERHATLVGGWSLRRIGGGVHSDLQTLFHFGTSNAPTDSRYPGLLVGGSQDSGRGLKLRRLSRLLGEGDLRWPSTDKCAKDSSEDMRFRDIVYAGLP